MKVLQSWKFFLLGQVLQGVQQKVEVLHTTVKMRSKNNKNLKNV